MNNINTINNNNINFSELSSRNSIHSLNMNKNYNTYYNSKFNFCNNNIHIKMKDDTNKSTNETLRVIKDQKGSK